MPLRTVSTFVASLRARSLQELTPFAILALTAAMLAIFGKIADEVIDGQTHAFDEAVLRALRNPHDLADPVGPAWLEHAIRDITSLGSFTVVALVTLIAIGYLLIDGKRGAAAFVLVHDFRACGVDERGARAHPAENAGADEAARLGRECEMDAHDVGDFGEILGRLRKCVRQGGARGSGCEAAA